MARRVMTIQARIDGPVRVGLREGAYTLFEILLALGIVAVLLGVTVPMISGGFDLSDSEEAVDRIQKTVLAAHGSAMESGEARRLRVLDEGLAVVGEAIPSAELPEGWKMQVRRFTENRFRRPERGETWEFNGAGICEPVALRLVGEEESIVLRFDPLTGLLLPGNE
jgi:hypothetical protein